MQYVVNELLTFVIHKLQWMPPDSVTQLCIGFYDDQVIERASKLLFEMCGSGSREDRYRRRQGEHKKMGTMRDIIAPVQRRNNELPVTFVAHNLSNLPPVTFDSIDVCVLISRMENMRLEMDALKAVVSTQTSVCDDLMQVFGGNAKPPETPSTRATETLSARDAETPAAQATETPSARAVETPSARASETPSARAIETRDAETPSARAVETRAIETPSARAAETPSARAIETRAVEIPSAQAAEMPSARAIETRDAETPSARAVETRAIETPSARAAETPSARAIETRAAETPSARAVETRAIETPSARAAETPSARAIETRAVEIPSAQAAEMPSARAIETRDAETPSARAVETRAIETPSARAAETPSARAIETRAAETPSARAIETPSARAADTPSAQAVETPSARAVETLPARAVETPSARAVETSATHSDETPADGLATHDQHTLSDWSTVVKRKKASQPMMSDNHPKRGNNHVRRNDRGSTVIGKATGLHIRAANKRLANIFVSRLAPDLSCDDISRHIEGVLRIKPVVELVKATSSYSSFHLTCECQDPKAFLDERIWPEGSLVRWWRADKRNNPIITATTELRSDDEILATTDAAL